MENKMTPIEALKHLQLLANVNDNYTGDDDCAEIIEQALVEHEKQKQILEVLKNKDVDLQNFKNSCNCEDYNEYVINEKGLLTEKEYDLLGEWLNNGK